jgi:hypothetical protein
VEIRSLDGALNAVRDSKDLPGTVLTGHTTPLNVAAFVRWVKA